jgi:Ca-activated chloride channel family protein
VPLSTLDLRVADPLWLLALALIPLVLWLRGRRRVPVLIVPFAAAWHRKTFSTTSRWPAILALTGLVLLIVALSRPQRVQDKREVRSQGYDLILAVDLSGSMLAEDYEKGGQALNRLQAIKPVIQAFINERANDRIGMVVFAGRAYTLAPLTFDHDWLARQTERLNIGMIEDGTAIGDGLGVALTRLNQAAHEENNQRKGAFIILLTDGSNNRGTLMPQQAAEIAKSRGIPIYTIGAGKDGWSRLPVMENGQKVGYTRIFSDLDEGLLHDIADTTGGHFYRADDLRTIESAFKSIDRAQKIEFQAKSYLITSELFHWLAIPGASLLILGAAMKWTLTRTTNPQATKNFATA